MIFGKYLKWDTLALEIAMRNHLEENGWNVSTSMGFANDGQSAFIDTARKNKCVIIIYLENDNKQIRMQGGTDGKYLPQGKQIPKYSKVFPHTQLTQASQYFEKIVEDLAEGYEK